MNTGALQSVPVRQLITPEPYSPPTMNAAFFIDGITITHCALANKFSGMPFSGVPRNSVRIVDASLSLLTSSFEGSANAVVAISNAAHAIPVFFIENLPRDRVQR